MHFYTGDFNVYFIIFREELDKLLQAWLNETTAYEDSHLGNFRRIYPSEKSDKYDMFFQSGNVLFQETATYKARFECARY